MVTKNDDLAPIVGKNLKRFRLQRGLSLERLSEVSSVSRAMLSQIERGQSAPNINTLDKISRAIGVNFSKLVHRSDLTPVKVFKYEENAPVLAEDGKSSVRTLLPKDKLAINQIGFYEVILKAKGTKSTVIYPQGSSQKLVVSQGSIGLKIEGKTFNLSKGDSAIFQADIPHSFLNLENSEAVFYVVLTQGE